MVSSKQSFKVNIIEFYLLCLIILVVILPVTSFVNDRTCKFVKYHVVGCDAVNTVTRCVLSVVR